MSKERISDIEDKTMEIMSLRSIKKKRLKKSEQNLKDTIKKSRYILWEFQKEKRDRKGRKII